MKLIALLVLVPALSQAAETYQCSYHDDDGGYTAFANLTLNGATADIAVGFVGSPVGCKNQGPMTVSGKKPVLTIEGVLACDQEDPDTVSIELDTAKKTLVMGPNDFKCK